MTLVSTAHAGERRFSACQMEAEFDAERHAPDIVDRLEDICSDIRLRMRELRNGLPVAREVLRGQSGHFYRIPMHNRSVCCGLLRDEDALYEAEVLTFKGTEPLARNFDAYLDWMLATKFRGSDFTVGMHFPLVLRMPPGAVPIDECLREQRMAVEVHSRHLATYDQLAQSPVPLFVYRVAEDEVARYLRRIERALPASAFDRVEIRTKQGLGVGVFYYPTSPIRVEDLGVLDSGLPLMRVATAAETVEQWVRLFAHFLHLGYMPYVPWNNGWGSCMDAGNACVDGGFADLVTLTRFRDIGSDRLFRTSLLSSLEILAHTVTSLGGAIDASGPVVVEPVGLAISTNFLRARLLRELRAEEGAGRAVDPRIFSSLEPGSFQAVVQMGRALVR